MLTAAVIGWRRLLLFEELLIAFAARLAHARGLLDPYRPELRRLTCNRDARFLGFCRTQLGPLLWCGWAERDKNKNGPPGASLMRIERTRFLLNSSNGDC
jgi:hypothetical protein